MHLRGEKKNVDSLAVSVWSRTGDSKTQKGRKSVTFTVEDPIPMDELANYIKECIRKRKS